MKVPTPAHREPRLYAAVEAVLRYGGASRRAGDLYGSRNLLSKARNVFKGLQVRLMRTCRLAPAPRH